MKANRSQWPNGTAYDYMDALSTEGLAWECLRRNSGYQKDFARYVRAEGDKNPIEAVIAARWGLRFRCEAEPHRCLPACPLDARGQSCRRLAHAAT